jgi:acetyl esterase/lipase
VASFDSRLAPEHRLPAAQEDGTHAMAWLRADADPWLADAARVFAGGNVAHHVAVKFGKTGLDAPVRLRGSVLITPAVTGATRTRAELAPCPPDAALTADMIDGYARLFLPDGGTKDHPAVNLAGSEVPPLAAVPMAPMLVVEAEHNVLRDRHAHYARRMKEGWGKRVEYAELAGVGHGFLDAERRRAGPDGPPVRRRAHGLRVGPLG